jgi:hypothetical protein
MIANDNSKVLEGRFDNAGVFNWTNLSNIDLRSATINNSGTFTLSSNASSPNLTTSDGVSTFNNTGTFAKTGAATSVFGPGNGTLTFNNQGVLNINKGTLDLRSLAPLGTSSAISSAPGANLILSGHLTGGSNNSTLYAPRGTTTFNDSGTHQLEVMSTNLGPTRQGLERNFAYDTIQISGNAVISLINASDNSPGAAPEALYVSTLNITSGSLNTNGIPVYARAVSGTVNGTVTLIPDGGPIDFGAYVPGKMLGLDEDGTKRPQAGFHVQHISDDGGVCPLASNIADQNHQPATRCQRLVASTQTALQGLKEYRVLRNGAQVVWMVAVADVPVRRMNPDEVRVAGRTLPKQVEPAVQVPAPESDVRACVRIQPGDDVPGRPRPHHRVGDTLSLVSEDQVLKEPAVAVPAILSVAPFIGPVRVRYDRGHIRFESVEVGCAGIWCFSDIGHGFPLRVVGGQLPTHLLNGVRQR